MSISPTDHVKKRRVGDTPTHLSDEIKKFRISDISPGELRLQKEIREMEGTEGVYFQEHSNCTVVKFLNISNDFPNTFSLMVPKYYPHYPPSIRCLNHGYTNEYISYNGSISHPAIENDWSPLDNLEKVLQVLHCIALSYDHSRDANFITQNDDGLMMDVSDGV